MRKSILIFIAGLGLTGCQRSCTACSRNMQESERDYSVLMYSGGDTVFYDQFTGIVNNNKESDGIYYFKGDTLIEVSGDYILKSK